MQIAQRETCIISPFDLQQRFQWGEDPARETKAVKRKKKIHASTSAAVQPQTLTHAHCPTGFACVTFMSLTMAWNNPPSAPHSFSTDSMVSNTNKRGIAERSVEISDGWCVHEHQRWRSGFVVHPPFSRPLLGRQRRGCEAPQPARRADKKERNVQLEGNRELLLLAAPLGRTGWMEQGRATGPGVAATAGKRGGHMHCVSS